MAQRTVSVKLVADVASYQSAMQKAATVTKDVGDKAADSSSRINQGFGRAKAGAVLLGGVLAGGVALGIKSVVGAASDLNETLNKSNVIFGDQSNRVAQWASSAAKNFGLSKQAALEAAASFGNMFQQLGFAGTQAADMSTDVVKLAADLGSFNNLETGDVLERIQAAFRGEYDSLQLLIPNISAARVEQEALAETGKTSADSLTAQEKATATLTIVQRDGAAAMNDFAETSNGLANSTKIAAAQFEDLKSRIGQDLLPVAQSAMHFFSDTVLPVIEGTYGAVKNLAGAFGDLPGPVQLASLAFITWAAAGDRVTGVFGKVRENFSGFRDELTVQQALYKQQSTGLSDVERAFGGLGTGAGDAGQKLSSVQMTMRGWDADLSRTAIQVEEVGKSGGRLTGAFGTAASAVSKFASAIGPELALAGATVVIASIVGSLDKIAHAGDDADTYVRELNHSLGQIDDNAGRIKVTADAIDDLKVKIQGAQEGLQDAAHMNAANPLGMIELVGAVKDGQANIDIFTEKLQELEDQQRAIQVSTSALQLQYGVTSDAVVNLADKYGIDLTDGVAQVTKAFANSGAAGEIASGAIAQVGNTADMTQGQIEAAAKAQEDWIKQLSQIGTAFADPLAAYQDLLGQKQEAEQASAQATADATESSKDSWKDYVGDVTVSLDEYAAKLEEQITNQENWRVNLATVAGRAGVEVAQILAGMGQEGVALVAQMANGTDAEVQRMAQDLITNAQLGGQGAASELDKAMKIMAIVGQQGANATVQAISAQLNIGVADVARIAAQYGINLASGINPLLASLGKPQVMVGGGGGRSIGQAVRNADGNLYENHQAEIAPGGAWRVWAEPETGGELYAPLAPSKRTKSKAIMEQGASIMGGEITWFADGGFSSESDVPRPPSTAPYRLPISTAGDAAMGSEYAAAVEWLKKNAVSVMSGSLAGVQLTGPIQSIVRSVANQFGWGSGSEWDALAWIIQHESGWRPTAQNPTSTAYGLFQFLNGTWASTGIPKTSDPARQSLAGLRYIQSRYRDPLGAQRFWQAHHWYGNGGVIPEPVIGLGLNSGDSYGFAEHGPEVVLPTGREMPGGGGSGGMTVSLDGVRISGTVAFDPSGMLRFVDARLVQGIEAVTDRRRTSG